MSPTRLLAILFPMFLAGCSSASQTARVAPPGARAAGASGAAGPSAGPDGASSAGASLTPEGAPRLTSPTTARTAQSGDAATRCGRLAGLLLEDAGRMLRFLGATEAQTRVVIERFRPLENSEFEVRCPSASPDVLACMETADNAYSGVARCGLLRGRPLTQRLILRPLIGATPWGAAEREVSDSAGAAALRSALIGSWDRQGRDAWTFTAAGEARQSFAQTPGAPGERFTTTSASRFFMTPSRGFFSAVVQGETLYLTLAEDGIAQPIPASGPIVLTERGFWLVEDLRTRPRCTGFNMYGQPVESARCAWEGQGDARRLLMMVGFGHDIAMGEAVGEVPLRFREMSGHLVPADNGARFYRRVESTTPAPAR